MTRVTGSCSAESFAAREDCPTASDTATKTQTAILHQRMARLLVQLRILDRMYRTNRFAAFGKTPAGFRHHEGRSRLGCSATVQPTLRHSVFIVIVPPCASAQL